MEVLGLVGQAEQKERRKSWSCSREEQGTGSAEAGRRLWSRLMRGGLGESHGAYQDVAHFALEAIIISSGSYSLIGGG